MFRTSGIAIGTLLVAGLSACSSRGGSASCGIDALMRPLAVKQSFAEGHSLTTPPESIPTGLPIRLVAGPAWHGSVASEGVAKWRVTTHGTVSKAARVGYGVLVVDYRDNPLGVLAFDGHVVRGAPNLGSLAIGDTVVPLLGVRIELSAIQNPRCPVFPDSLR